MLTFALSYRRRADDEAAVGYRLSDTGEFSRGCENGGGVYGRPRFLKRNEVVVYQPQVGKAEVVHGSSDSAYVVRIARPHQDDRNPLALGIVDVFQQHGLKIWGVNKKAAQFEASKVFSQKFMEKYGIPTARAGTFSDPVAAKNFAAALDGKCAVKADGLALGKGVLICSTVAEADQAIDEILATPGKKN